MTDAEAAVIDAARKWVEAKEVILAVDDARLDDLASREDTERALDQAEYELTDALYRLRERDHRFHYTVVGQFERVIIRRA